MIQKILIVNRGEIAVRVIRACKELGITSAAIYSTPDIRMLHTKLADEAYHFEGTTSQETYLNADRILKLAKDINADAIHPGYGFFSENPDFIERVERNGIIFIGPSSKSVRMMGSKTAARELMKRNNVAIVPGTTEPIKSTEEGKKIANEIGYPVLMKAAAGGGGKGMRKVFNDKEFDSAFEAVKREAMKSFANDDIYLEKLIVNPKHIEVQILGDKLGNYVHLFERDCSIQRRHQKIIEEAPAATLDQEARARVTKLAVDAARACNYYNAGTIECLMDEKKNFYFLEMNTRLQVEHPVTEMITGVDLVREQIRIAEGLPISFNQDDLAISGSSIECRLYAEDEENFLPSTGTIDHLEFPSGPGVRIDSGVYQGSEVSVYYDPMIAKLIVHSKDRESSIKRMLRLLDEIRISGISTNLNFLKNILKADRFLDGTFSINYLENEFNIRTENGENELDEVAALIAALLSDGKKSPSVKSEVKSLNNWVKLQYE